MSEGGAKAVRKGLAVERQLRSICLESGYRLEAPPEIELPSGHCKRPDLFLPEIPLLVESKWEDSRGTAWEKVALLILVIRNFYPFPTWIVLGGRKWLAENIPQYFNSIPELEPANNYLGFISYEEFHSKAMNGELQ